MPFLSGFNVTLNKAELLGEAAMASFAGAPVPSGWSVVTPAALGLGSNYQDGNYYRDGATGASAIVLRQGNDYIVSFRGTDDATDASYYSELFFGTYINHFSPLLSALASQAPAGALFSFTGASLGGGATNNLAAIADIAYGGCFTDATFVGFASPNITNANGILNLGVENDPVYKSVNSVFPFTQYQDYASSIDNLVLANDSYVAGSLSNIPEQLGTRSLTLVSRALMRHGDRHYPRGKRYRERHCRVEGDRGDPHQRHRPFRIGNGGG